MILASGAFHVDLGDAPTWLAVVAAAGAAFIALRALRTQNSETARQVAALERQQADAVDLELVDSTDNPSIYMANITNNSRRPVRDATCRLDPRNSDPIVRPARMGLLADWKLGGQVARRIMVDAVDVFSGQKASLVRASTTMCFTFTYGRSDHPHAQVTARFTDDACLHWQIDHNLHLQKLASRDR